MKIKLNKKSIKQLNSATVLPHAQTPNIAGGTATQGACNTLGCDTAVYLGCPTGRGCYSGVREICMNPF